MPVDNPRFPHFCRILRKKTDSPLGDEGGYTPLCDGGRGAVCDCCCYSRQSSYGVFKTQASAKEEDPSERCAVALIYEGECRSYEKNTTSDRGEVVTSYRGLALPLTQDDWVRLGVVPMEGDEIVVCRGSYQEYGHVIDKNPANFGGTHLTWRYGRN